MPVTLVDRLPLPNLKVYTAGSVLLVSVAIYYALNVTSDPNWRGNVTVARAEAPGEDVAVAAGLAPAAAEEPALPPLPSLKSSRNLTEQFAEVMTFMMQEPLCMWTVINMAYCTLAVCGCVVQRAVFGQLRVAEAQRVKDKFWNYVFYKFIFVFGVINVQYMDEVVLWCAWFSLLGALHLLAQLCKDRFEYLSSSPANVGWAHVRLALLLGGILAAGGALFAAAVACGLPQGRDTFAFMAAECILVVVSALHVCARYVLQLRAADAAGPLTYYTHLVFDSVALVVELVHVIHMVVYSNMLVSMASLVLLMQLRHLLHELQARLQRHRLYTERATHMTRTCPMASKEEVEKNQDNCAICWEPMKEARKLPCKHLFHNSCLCQWVQQDASCPTCRRTLARRASPAPASAASARQPPHNHLFHFNVRVAASMQACVAPLAISLSVVVFAALLALLELKLLTWSHYQPDRGSRYVSWLPSFSVEVTRVRAAPRPDQIDAMARQVQQLFPQFPLSALAADLASTRSADLTLDNILEGRLLPPPEPAPAPPAPAPALLEASTDTDAMEPPPPREPAPSGVSVAVNFSESAAEREWSLRRRKDALVAAARDRYLARHPPAGAHSRPHPADTHS